MANLKEDTLQRLDADETYKKALAGLDEDARKSADAIVREFIGDLADALSRLGEPDVRERLQELLKQRG